MHQRRQRAWNWGGGGGGGASCIAHNLTNCNALYEVRGGWFKCKIT